MNTTATTCPNCRAAAQPGAAFCAACGRRLPRAEAAAVRIIRASALYGVFFGALGVFGWLMWSGMNRPGAPIVSTPADRARDACYIARQFVKDRLKAPTTAQFENCLDARITTTTAGYSVIIVVDAQNSYGAMIRSHYAVEVKDLGDKWQLVRLDQVR